MQINIFKFINDETHEKGHVAYILHPENIIEIHDTETGCLIKYANGDHTGEIKDVSARQLKRSIQEQLEQPLGFLKTEYTYMGHPGLRYFNVDHVAAVKSRWVYRDGKRINLCEIELETVRDPVKIDHEAHEVAYQVRRIMKRLDQDQEICCAPETDTE